MEIQNFDSEWAIQTFGITRQFGDRAAVHTFDLKMRKGLVLGIFTY
jgi:ABC-type uncharacterized transport system ATPase subunit